MDKKRASVVYLHMQSNLRKQNGIQKWTNPDWTSLLYTNSNCSKLANEQQTAKHHRWRSDGHSGYIF